MSCSLRRRSNPLGLRQLALHLAALGASGTLVYWSAGDAWRPLAQGLYGVILVFLFAPLHECIHATAFRARAYNRLVAWPCGLLLALPPRYFRAFHFAHHRYTQDPERDPELATPKPATLVAYLRQVSGLPYWYERLTTLTRHATGAVSEPFVAPRLRPAVVREARVFLVCYAAILIVSILAGSRLVLDYWLLPALLGQPLLRLYLLAEHTGCPLTPDMLANSRTTRSNALMRALAWNMPYHAEHHFRPAVPFHALPKLHAKLGSRVACQARGYIAVHRELIKTIEGNPFMRRHGVSE